MSGVSSLADSVRKPLERGERYCTQTKTSVQQESGIERHIRMKCFINPPAPNQNWKPVIVTQRFIVPVPCTSCEGRTLIGAPPQLDQVPTSFD